MFEETVNELYELCKAAMAAGAHVSVHISNDAMNIGIVDNGQCGEIYDGFYILYNRKELEEKNEKEFHAAKEHLERLIKEKKE